MRWLHTYVSMAGLGALLFFSLTGITLNHPDWMLGGSRRESRLDGTLPAPLLAAGKPDDAIDRLGVVEHLRRAHAIRGWVDDFRADEREISIAFKGPGSSVDVTVDRPTGRYTATGITEGWLSVVNDLHKGRHTGTVWAWVIDVSGIVLALVSASGLWLLLYVRRRRLTGLWTGLAGAALLWAVYAMAVK